MTRNYLRLTTLAVIAGLAVACGSHIPPHSKDNYPNPPIDPWLLTVVDPSDSIPALLWNGRLGLRINRDGSGRGQPCFSINDYETSGEEKIRPLPSPLPNGFLIQGKLLPITGSYRQSLNMKTSELTTQWVSGNLVVGCVICLDPTIKQFVEKWTLTGLPKSASFDFDLGPFGTLKKTISDFSRSHQNEPALPARYKIKVNQSGTITVEIRVEVTDTPSTQTSKDAFAITDFYSIERRTKRIWAERWKTDIVIDGPVEDQQAIHSFLFYLRSAIAPNVNRSLSPFGLSNQTYSGHVFWDADIWDFPALVLVDPEAAKSIVNYRLINAKNGLSGASGTMLRFPWESSVSGKETAPTPFRKEIHISGDVAWMLHQASQLGLCESGEAEEVRKAVGFMYRSMATVDGSLNDVMSPDENHVGNNDLYTNLLAQWTVSGTFRPTDIAAFRYKIPHDDKTLFTYDGDLVKGYKQAAAALSIYPLQYPPAEQQAKVMMDRFANKVTRNGPAMSDSVHALIWARLGNPDRAYKYWQESWKPFTNNGLLLFSEKRTKPNTYFTTGAAGSLQTVLFGFLGIRLDFVKERDATWSLPLRGGWLSIKPNFPREWKSVRLMNFTALGRRYTLTATHRANGPDAVQVIQGD